MCLSGMWIILSKRPLRPLEIKRNFCFLLHYLEEFELAAWLTIRVAIKKWLFLPTYMTGQTTNYWTCAVSAITLKPPGALLHPQLRISCGPQFPFLCLSLSCMQVLWLSHACGVPIHVHLYHTRLPSLANMSHVYLIIKPTEMTWSAEEHCFLLHRSNTFNYERLLGPICLWECGRANSKSQGWEVKG